MTILGALSVIAGWAALGTGALGIALCIVHHFKAPASPGLIRKAGMALTASLLLFFLCGARLLATGQWKAALGVIAVMAIAAALLFWGKPQPYPGRPDTGRADTPDETTEPDDAEPAPDDVSERLQIR